MQAGTQWTEDLLQRHGELVSQKDLVRLLGYPSLRAVQKASERGRLPIKTFSVPGRRGKFAFTRDVAAWLKDLRSGAADTLQPAGSAQKEAAM